MYPTAVLISYDHPLNHISVRASGIYYNDGYILTHGTILVPLLHVPTQKRWLKTFLKSLTTRLEKCNHLDSNITFRAYEEVKNRGGDERKLVSLSGEAAVVGAWKCPLVSRSVATLFHDWTLGDVARGKEVNFETNVDNDTSKELMSVFILLRTNHEVDSNSKANSCYFSDLWMSLSEPIRGQDVLVESTPFGSELFINSLSRGIVSNVVGHQRCLLLTDARTVIGCEGGPIFATSNLSLDAEEKGRVLGLVSCSLTWWRGEWVGLTIGISLAPVLRRLVRSPVVTSVAPQPNIDNALSNSAAQNIADEAVVLVRCGCSWGSGVVLDARSGLVVTCSHVLRNEATDKVSIFHKGNYYPADVIFRTRDGLAYDLAFIKTSEASVFTDQMELADDDAQKGEVVIAAGFPLLSEREDSSLRPTLVHGCVARTCPFMFQTTCCIQSGASGGAILRDDKLLGIIVCNAKDSNTGALFPHVNFAVPASAFRDDILKYIETGAIAHLETLESADQSIQTIWKLRSHSSKL